jgi:hypothetical protein
MRSGGVFWYGGKKWGVQIEGVWTLRHRPPRGEALVIIDQPSYVSDVWKDNPIVLLSADLFIRVRGPEAVMRDDTNKRPEC